MTDNQEKGATLRDGSWQTPVCIMTGDFGQVSMSFCPTCGRPRDADQRYCAGCGHEFRAPAPVDATRLEPAPVDATRLEPAAVDATRAPSPTEPSQPAGPARPAEPAEPDPFAAWFAPAAAARPADRPVPARTEPSGPWPGADTVYAMPPPVPPYRMPPPSGPGYPLSPGPVPGGPARRPARGAKAALVLVLVLVVLGAGGGTYAFISRSGKTAAAGPPSAGTASAAPTAISASPSAASSPGGGQSASAAPSASPSPSLVAVASAVGSNPATPAVETVLSHFFQGINTHRYPEYISALDSQVRARQSPSSFSKGYSTTADSAMTLTSLESTGSGTLAATVTFTSHQAASSSVDSSTCNNWTLIFYLVPQGTGYLDGSAPSGYQPVYSDC